MKCFKNLKNPSLEGKMWTAHDVNISRQFSKMHVGAPIGFQ